MKRLVCGILAHVDSGKTTLSEAMLYTCGMIRKAGRVDKKDAYLDHYALERERGITIFSKQALLKMDDMQIALIDTPGHVDFSAEMERALQIMDYAVLLVSAPDGVQGHTETLWRLLARYQIPTFLFVNKTDQPCPPKSELLKELGGKLSASCVDFSGPDTELFYEQAALGSEQALEAYLANGMLTDEMITDMIAKREIFPCFFGSALHIEGVRELLHALSRYTAGPVYGEEFAARVYKIGRDEQGNRLTYLKVTGGTLAVRDAVSYQSGEGQVSEKISQIRVYSGVRFETPACVQAGEVCAVAGLTKTRAGDGLGAEKGCMPPVLVPVLNYQMILPEDVDPMQFLPKLRQLEDEEPQLHIVWNERLAEIHVQLMGEVQIEVLERLIRERFMVAVHFGAGKIVYRETLAGTVEGVGHFEPLRHYAEVHLLMEPGERGSGLHFACACSEDELDRNWQRLVLTHLEEKEHVGVLTGSPITDMKITLVSGRAHSKHTEGGDFRQATYRAVRQGLRSGRCVLLEPYYRFAVSVPAQQIGRVMSDMERMNATFGAPLANGGNMELAGTGPAALLAEYAKELGAFTGGRGKISLTFHGYEPCHNAQEVVEASGYDPESDLENPTGSVFCAHGGGFQVPWDRVREYMHLESFFEKKRPESVRPAEGADGALPYTRTGDGGMGFSGADNAANGAQEGMSASDFHVKREERPLGVEEIDEIIARSVGANKKNKTAPEKIVRNERRKYRAESRTGEEYLLVDGYNVIFAWDDLRELAGANVDAARGRLLDVLCNYQAMRGCELIVVFDAYRVQGHGEELLDYHNIHVVYTKEAETADQYIEKFAHNNSARYRITVATSDGLEQIIIRGEGCALLSSRDLRAEIESRSDAFRQEHMARAERLGNTMEKQLGRLGDLSEAEDEG